MSKTNDTHDPDTAEPNAPTIDANIQAALKPGLLDRLVKDTRIEGLTSRTPITEWFTPERDTIIQDYARVQRAFKHEYAVERDGGNAVVGAIKVGPASMAMHKKEDILPHIHAFAAILSALPDHQRGMLVDVPRAVDFTDHQKSARKHMQRLESEIEDVLRPSNDDADPEQSYEPSDFAGIVDPSLESVEAEAARTVLAMERNKAVADGGVAADTTDPWSLQLQADIAKERATVESFYQHTSSKREHYIVLEVNELDAARTLSGINGGLADLEFIGKPIKDRRVNRLKEENELTGIMVRELNRRLESLVESLEQLEGLSARRIPSAEFTQVIADAYRPDDVSQIKNFTDMVRRSPVPDDEDAGDPSHSVTHPSEDIEFCEGISDVSDEEDLLHQYRTLVMPTEFTPESDGSITLNGDTLSATLKVTGWPEIPTTAFLEELYRYNQTGVDVKIATHFQKKHNPKREVKNQEHSMEERLEGQFGTYFEDYVRGKYEEAKAFAKSIEGSKFAVFDVGLSVTVEASTRHWDEDTGEVHHSDRRLTQALEDIEMTLERDCGLDTERMGDRHDEGWQTSIPICNNELGENVSLRADGLARQWPFQYKNREDPDGTMFGLHDYLKEPTRVDVGDLENGHNIGIYGTIGSGKTTTMQHLANSFKQHHDERSLPFKMILSTPLQDLKTLSDVYGGETIRVGKDAAVNPLNIPYVDPDSYQGVQQGSPWYGFLNRFDAFLYSYYEMMGLSDIGDKRDTWIMAAKEAQHRNGIEQGNPESYKNPSATIPDVIDVLQDIILDPAGYVPERLREEEGTLKKRQAAARDIVTHDIEAFDPDSGRFSHFCRHSDLNLMDHDVIFLDHQDQENNEHSGGLEMMMRLSDLHEQQKGFQGATMMAVDEFHYMLSNPRAASFFYRLHRHSRHWNEWIVLATQEIGDLFEETTDKEGNTNISLSQSAKVIFNNQAMQLYHYTKEMNPVWADQLNLTPRSEEYISDADTGKKSDGYSQALFVVDEEQYPLRIEMSDDINPRQFAIYQHDPANDPETKEYLADYTDAQGRDVCNWRWD